MRKEILKWEMAGAVLIIVLGALQHYTFGWAHHPAWLAPFVPVNESVWEHLKLAYWPALLFGIAGYFRWRPSWPAFLLAKSCGILMVPAVILCGHVFYTSFVGHPILAVDIPLYGLAVVLGQLLSVKLIDKTGVPPRAYLYAGILTILFGVSLVNFTFNPPEYPIFMDRNSGMYGISGGQQGSWLIKLKE